jgi:cyclophilin family peptidyl-prolyl cis-trans isomerase
MARFPGDGVNGSQFFFLKSDWPNGGPGNVVFNHFGTVLGGSTLIAQIKPGDRILGITISVQ